MFQYNFHNFDDYEFELLCRDLINEEQRINVKTNHGFGKDKPFILNFSSFKRGADKGIDLHFLYEKENIEVIGQVKLSRGNFNDVFSSIKKKHNSRNELDKIKELAPNKYIFMTSVPLSLENKKKIKEHFSPYIIRLEDIYGQEDLNKLLGQFEQIHRRYIKLYFHSPLVLEKLLNEATLHRSSFELKEIIEELPFYIQTSHFSEALTILQNQHILIIKGSPGVGKTALAKMLALYYATQDFQFIRIDSIDDEIERLISKDEKAIYYYDDFLGSNELIIKDALKNESKLNRLIRQISLSKTKFLVLTSRSTILNNAKSLSEKLNSLFRKVQNFELQLDNINIKEKKLILNSHLKRNQIPETVFSAELVHFILNYKTFSPRLIQFITDRYQENKNDFASFVQKSIKYPEEIWKYAYQTEINFTCQIFLSHLFLFGQDYDLHGFQKSFENRITFESITNQFSKTGFEFRNCIDKLNEAFIKIHAYLIDNEYDTNNYIIEFLNPSITDFLLSETKNNLFIIKNSIKSFDDVNLLTYRFNHNNKDFFRLFSETELEQILLYQDHSETLLNIFDKLAFLKILPFYFPIETIEKKHTSLINSCLEHNFISSTFDFLGFLRSYSSSKRVQQFIEDNLNYLAGMFFLTCNYQEDFDETLDLFRELGYSPNELLVSIDNNIFSEALERIIHDRIDQVLYVRSDIISSNNDIEQISTEVKQEFSKYKFFENEIDSFIYNKINDINWDHIMEYNKIKTSGRNL